MAKAEIAPEEKIKEAKKKLLRRALAEDEGTAAPRKLTPMQQKKLLARKKKMRRYALLGVVGLFSYLVYWGFKPYKTGLNYGICKVFIEQSVLYPDTLHFSEVMDFSDSVRIWYSYYDSFGDYRLQQAQCYFRLDDTYGYAVSRITIGRLEVDPDKINLFNHSLGSIIKNPPDLTYPTPLPNDIKDLKFEFEKFRKAIL